MTTPLPETTPETVSRGRVPSPAVAPTPSAAAATGPVWPRHVMATAVLLAFGMFLSILNTAIVGIDYAPISKELGGSQIDIQWVTTAYRAGQAAVIPAVAWFCTRLGHRRVFLLTMLLFAVTSALCGLAGSLDQLIAFRVLQAVPGAIPPVVCLLMFNRLTPKPKLPLALALYIMIVVSAAGLAPLLGGYLGQFWDWRAIFLAEIPLALVGAAVAVVLLPDTPGHRDRRFDWLGFVCGGCGLAALLIAANEGQDWGWTSYRLLLVAAVGFDALLLFAYVELRVRQPLLDLRVLLDRSFVISLAMIGVMFTGVFVVLADVPAFLLVTQQLTPTNAGLLMVPQALAWIVSIPIAGALYRLLDGRWQTTAGLLLLGGGTIALTRIDVDIPRSFLTLLLCVRAVGLGLVLVPLLGAGVASIPLRLVADALTVRLVAQRVVSGIGVGALTALTTVRRVEVFSDSSTLLTPGTVATDPAVTALQRQGPGGLAQLYQSIQGASLTQAYSDVFLVSGVLTLLCIGLLLFIRRAAPPTST